MATLLQSDFFPIDSLFGATKNSMAPTLPHLIACRRNLCWHEKQRQRKREHEKAESCVDRSLARSGIVHGEEPTRNEH
jgi:hypothetical protein